MSRRKTTGAAAPTALLVTLASLAGFLVAGMGASQERHEREGLRDRDRDERVAAKIFDCDSDIAVSHTPTNPAATDYNVTMTITNVLTTDGANTPVNQTYAMATYLPDCTAVVPCVPNPGGVATFVGVTGTTCPGGIAALAATPTVPFDRVDFTWPGGPTPGVLTLFSGTSCSIDFQIQLPAAPIMTFVTEVVTTADCSETGAALNATTFGTESIMPVPALGKLATVLLLTLVLGAGCYYLRRPKLPFVAS